MSSENAASGQAGKTAIERVIEHHQLRTHDARSTVLQTQHVLAHVPRKPRLRLQQEVLDYYHALKPLREHPEVEGWWDDVRLSDQWIKDKTVSQEVVQDVVGDIETGVQVTERLEEDVEIEYYEGLDTIPEKLTETETSVSVSHGLSGPSMSKQTKRRVLDADILIDVAGVLDDATIKLGFGPEGDTPVADPLDNMVDPKGGGE